MCECVSMSPGVTNLPVPSIDDRARRRGQVALGDDRDLALVEDDGAARDRPAGREHQRRRRGSRRAARRGASRSQPSATEPWSCHGGGGQDRAAAPRPAGEAGGGETALPQPAQSASAGRARSEEARHRARDGTTAVRPHRTSCWRRSPGPGCRGEIGRRPPASDLRGLDGTQRFQSRPDRPHGARPERRRARAHAAPPALAHRPRRGSRRSCTRSTRRAPSRPSSRGSACRSRWSPPRTGIDARLPLRLANRLRRAGARLVHTHNATPHLYGARRRRDRAGPRGRPLPARRPHQARPRTSPTCPARCCVNRFASALSDRVVAVSDDAAAVARRDRARRPAQGPHHPERRGHPGVPARRRSPRRARRARRAGRGASTSGASPGSPPSRTTRTLLDCVRARPAASSPTRTSR